MNPGRNDACPCGSGKKYKKCCIPKYDKPVATAVMSMLAPSKKNTRLSTAPSFRDLDLWMPDQLNPMSDEQIVSKLDELGIPVSRDEFIEDLQRTLDPGKVAGIWRERYQVNIQGKDSDYPYCAAMQLSRRWAPELYSIEKLEELVERLDDCYGDEQVYQRLDLHRLIWKQLKQLYIAPMSLRSLVQFHDEMDTTIDFEWVTEEYEHELRNASIGRQEQERNALLEERITVCQEMLELLPDMDPHNRLNLRRDIAESYELMDNYVQAEHLYEQLTEEHPDWVWGYVGWGDMYEKMGNKEQAEQTYRLGLGRSSEDREVLLERLGG